MGVNVEILNFRMHHLLALVVTSHTILSHAEVGAVLIGEFIFVVVFPNRSSLGSSTSRLLLTSTNLCQSLDLLNRLIHF